MMLPPVNYLAVLVSAVVLFILGGAWYSKALFAKPWMKLQGINPDAVMTPEQKKRMPAMLLQAFLCGLVTSYVMAVLLNHFVDLTPARGALVGCLCWIGFAGPAAYANTLFSMRSRKLWVIDSGHTLVGFVLAGVILAVWR